MRLARWALTVLSLFVSQRLRVQAAKLTDRLGVTAVPFILAFEDRRLIQPVTAINVIEHPQADAVRDWALNEPDRFYAGDIDLDWQAVQRTAGR